MKFNKLDIAQAHYLVEVYWNIGGWLRERPSNKRRMEATHVQLHRIGMNYNKWLDLTYDSLSENGKKIYNQLEKRYNFAE
jgi:hypothetical protein